MKFGRRNTIFLGLATAVLLTASGCSGGLLSGSGSDSGDTATLSYGVVDAPGHVTNAAVAGAFGSLTVNSHGTYNYVPNAAAINALQGGSYTDTFTVQTTDVHGAVGTATLTVEVKGANDTPSIVGEANPPRKSPWWQPPPRRTCLPPA